MLSPGSNPFHYNHIHIDLAMHGMTSTGPRRICKPARQITEPPSRKDGLPDAPEIEDDLDIAQSGPPRENRAYAMHSGPDLALAAATIAAADPARRQNQTPQPARRPSQNATGAVALHAPAPEQAPAAPQRGAMRDDGVFEPEGAPADFDLPTSRVTR